MRTHPEYNNLLLFDSLCNEEGISHFSTTRIGGVSHGSYASLNTGNFSDDSPLNINENRSIVARMFYMDLSDFIIPHQTHDTKVLVIDKQFLELDYSIAVELLYGVDALVTKERGLFICVTTADCVPILLYDNKQEVIASIHAGWKGTVNRIVENTVREMTSRFGTLPQDIKAGIGPSISQTNYEVGDEVIEQFNNNGFNLSDEKVCKKSVVTSKYHIDLKEINRIELIRLGVFDENIEKTHLCTFDKEELFFSARRQTTHSGRMLTGIKLKEK